MTQYQKGMIVMKFLQKLGVNLITIGEAIDDKNLEKSYQTIQNNPKITKELFLKTMEIEEVED